MIKPLDIPVVETERLILRGWEERDVATVASMMGDEETARYIGGIQEEWQAFRYVASFIGHWQMRSFGMFCVEEKTSSTCIGWAGPWFPAGWPEHEIGYSFLRSSWGKGYATEAAIGALGFAYEKLGWKTAVSCIDEHNTASQKVSQRMGAELEAKNQKVCFFTADVWRHLPPKEFAERFLK